MKTLNAFGIAFFLFIPGVFSQGHLLWNEPVDGHLGEFPGAATPLGTLQLGTNTVIGMSELVPFGDGGFLLHGDYFTYSIPAGFQLSTLYIQVDRPQGLTWLGTSFNSELGHTFNTTSGSLLPQLAISSLGAGAYATYFENLDNQPVMSVANYRMDFVLTAVPEPSTWALLGLGTVAFWFAARRRRK